MNLDDFKYRPMQKFLIRWQTRALGSYVDKIMFVLPILIHINKDNFAFCIKTTRAILEHIFNDEFLEQKIFDRVIFKLKEYAKDETRFAQDKERIYELLSDNITMFSIVITLLDKKQVEVLEQLSKEVRQKYDENFKLDKSGLRLLAFQEKYNQV